MVSMPRRLLIGLVSDTHGRFDPSLRSLFAQCDLVVHAGDVGGREILSLLDCVAPVTVARGNNDFGDLAVLPEVATLRLGLLKALVIHELGKPEKPLPRVAQILDAERPDIVIYGHSHRPAQVLRDGRLYLNPGSAGPHRFKLPRTAGVLEVIGRAVRAEVWDLDCDPPRTLNEPFEAVL